MNTANFNLHKSMDASNILLWPTPKSFHVNGGSNTVARVFVQEALDPHRRDLEHAEAYRVALQNEKAVLTARTEDGLRCARATWAQLASYDQLPDLVIEDAPLFTHRGVMLDISRDRVPTMASLLCLVDQLASWKINHLQLYVEHTLAYRGHEDAWRAASPLTLDELSELDRYGAERGVALTANQNCLGHFERWLRHPRYAPLGERDQGMVTQEGHYLAPNTLCATDPAALDLIHDLISQQWPCCSGAYANIGCDEPYDLGLGRSREACEKRGKAAVFSDYVSAVASLSRKYGKRPQFWCDPQPNENQNLPEDLVALIWGYEAGQDFSSRAAAHRAAGREVWVAPGTSCWKSTTGRTWNRRGNLDRAAREADAPGFLCTVWGDQGHRQPWPVTLMGLADAAQAAWHGPGFYDNRAAGRYAFGDEALGDWLAELGDVDAEICRGETPLLDGSPSPGQQVWNQTALWHDMNIPFLEREGVGDVDAWRMVKARLESLRARLPASVDPVVKAECVYAVDTADWAADRAIMRRLKSTREQRLDLSSRMAGIIAEHRRQWLLRARYGGLEDSAAHWVRLITHD
jgi:hexosaminidase